MDFKILVLESYAVILIYSTLQELENALISITEGDGTDQPTLPQYDGAGDEEMPTSSSHLGEYSPIVLTAQ